MHREYHKPTHGHTWEGMMGTWSCSCGSSVLSAVPSPASSCPSHPPLPSSSLSTASLLSFFPAITQASLFCMYYKEGSSKNQQSPEPQRLPQCLSGRTSSCYLSLNFWQFLLKKNFNAHFQREKYNEPPTYPPFRFNNYQDFISSVLYFFEILF